MTFHILGISSSQLTIIFQSWNHQLSILGTGLCALARAQRGDRSDWLHDINTSLPNDGGELKRDEKLWEDNILDGSKLSSTMGILSWLQVRCFEATDRWLTSTQINSHSSAWCYSLALLCALAAPQQCRLPIYSPESSAPAPFDAKIRSGGAPCAPLIPTFDAPKWCRLPTWLNLLHSSGAERKWRRNDRKCKYVGGFLK